jgi:predicted transcriptional regulator of viral defense system
MSYYDIIYEHATDNYGLITSAQAKDLKIPSIELVKLSHRGRLQRIWQGVYRISHYIPAPLDKYAEAVAIVGEGAFIYGESVLAMHGLALLNPALLYVATSKRVRKTLPKYIKIVNVKKISPVEYYEGIPSQDIVSAITICREQIMTDRLSNAIEGAEKLGLISQADRTYLEELLDT